MQSPFPEEQRQFTARIVTMGDDRVLGHLAKTYYSFRQREARKLFLTKKVDFQFYYIPVCKDPTPVSSVKENRHSSKRNPCALGSYLGMVDPWYDSNIKCLGSIIPNMAKMQQENPKRTKDPFVSDVISYYVRTARQPVYFTIYSVKISFCSEAKKEEPAEDVFLTNLEIEFPEFKQIAASVKGKQRKNSAEALGAVISINYKKVTLSGRDIDTGVSFRTSGAQISAIPSSDTEDRDCLTLVLNECQTKNKNAEPKIQTSNMKITAVDGKSFSAILDKDCRRTFRNVQSIEISPCLDPAYCAQQSFRSKSKLGEEKDAGLSKYMNKELLFPINTFAGIIN